MTVVSVIVREEFFQNKQKYDMWTKHDIGRSLNVCACGFCFLPSFPSSSHPSDNHFLEQTYMFNIFTQIQSIINPQVTCAKGSTVSYNDDSYHENIVKRILKGLI